MKIKLYCIIAFGLMLSSIFSFNPVFAWDFGVATTSDFQGIWLQDLQDFASILNAYQGWNEGFTSGAAQTVWWQEEANGGIDNQKADNTELSLIFAHGGPNGTVGFGPGQPNAGPDTIKLGYTSPDSTGKNLWWFIIECEVLNDSSYTS